MTNTLHWLVLVLAVGVSQSKDTTPVVEEEPAIVSPPPQSFDFVTKLEDGTFEHLTQASTGGTTGSWLIYFHYSQDDTSFTGRFPSEQEFLDQQLVMGSLDVDHNPQTMARFRKTTMQKFPRLVYLHRQTMYQFQLTDWREIMALVDRPPAYMAEAIPSPPGLLDTISEHWDTFHEHPNSWLMLGMMVSFAFLSCLARLVAYVGEEDEEVDEDSKKHS